MALIGITCFSLTYLVKSIPFSSKFLPILAQCLSILGQLGCGKVSLEEVVDLHSCAKM